MNPRDADPLVVAATVRETLLTVRRALSQVDDLLAEATGVLELDLEPLEQDPEMGDDRSICADCGEVANPTEKACADCGWACDPEWVLDAPAGYSGGRKMEPKGPRTRHDAPARAHAQDLFIHQGSEDPSEGVGRGE